MPRGRSANGLHTGSNASTSVNRVATARAKGSGPQLRDKGTINRLNMYRSKIKRDDKGKIVKGGLQVGNQVRDMQCARIAPDRRWFGNTRVVGQQEMQAFREEVAEKVNDPYSVLIKQHKLPMGLLKDAPSARRMDLLGAETYESTFGPRKVRKRAKLGVYDLESLVAKAEGAAEGYVETADTSIERGVADFTVQSREKVFEAGMSKRIKGEVLKVVDSSDVIVQVLDARDPLGTRAYHVEQFIRKNASHKHLIFVLNKCDLLPTKVTAHWIKVLSKEVPTVAFHASITNPFGKGAFINLLRQFGKLHADKKAISVGFIGYPNVGKSSVINTLRKKKVCNVAPIPGETKVWQYITLFKRIYLIDCPGTVMPSNCSETELVLKGVVRIERIEDCTVHVQGVLERVKKEYVQRTYGIQTWEDHEDFLTQLARKHGKLLKGNEPDLNTAAKGVIFDYLRGRLPYFTLPPDDGEGKAVVPADTLALQSLPALPELPDDFAPRQDMRELEPHVTAATEKLERGEADGEDVSDVEEDDEADEEAAAAARPGARPARKSLGVEAVAADGGKPGGEGWLEAGGGGGRKAKRGRDGKGKAAGTAAKPAAADSVVRWDEVFDDEE
ncbi:NUC091 domain-containing protein [Pavlovales sp. CCMP2436]|nr:NUC091 domain-containing protein [Pavlovales sp. CCMP2436]